MRRYSIVDMKKKAREFGGKCLSTKYKSVEEKLTWKCKRNHVFEASVGNVIYRNRWCPKCGLVKRAKAQANTIADCHKLANSKGGACLSKVYENVGQQLKWQCTEGHKWNAPYRSINGSVNRVGTWCPKCNGKKKRNITYARGVAKSLGWKCLSESYLNYNDKMKWQCFNGHIFDQSLAKVVSRKSCPKCNYFLGEELCRFYFESIFQEPFVKVRPEFLKRGKGSYDELDGYSEKLKIAFEHQGRQHYKHVDRFHQGRTSLEKQQDHDKRKRELCIQNGILLIEIPSVPEYTPIQALKDFIVNELQNNKIEFDHSKVPLEIDYKYFSNTSVLNYLGELAKKRDGKLLSKVYLGGRYKLKWKCKNAHTWEATPENIIGSKAKVGTWCPKCGVVARSRKQADSIENIKLFAISNGGLCLSESYTNAHEKLQWQCGKKHKWWANTNSLKSGSWCPFCAGKLVTLDSINEWAGQFSGKCISKTYERNSLPLEWCCKLGHKWQMSLSKMQRRVSVSKFWCQECRLKSKSSGRIYP